MNPNDPNAGGTVDPNAGQTPVADPNAPVAPVEPVVPPVAETPAETPAPLGDQPTSDEGGGQPGGAPAAY